MKLETYAIALLVAVGKLANHAVEFLFVKDVVNADTAAGSLGRIRRANAATGSADGAGSELDFFESINGGVEVEVDLSAVADLDAITDAVKALGLELLELLEERGTV